MRSTQWPIAAAATILGVALMAAGCANGSPSASITPATTASPSAPSSPAVSQRNQPSMTPSASALTKAPAPPKPRTTGQLRTALLGLKDVPAGMELDSSSGADDGAVMTSSRPACTALVHLMNAKKLPGSIVDVEVSFSGGQYGPFVAESLDAMGSSTTASRVVATYRTAVKKCDAVTLSIPGAGQSMVSVRQISFTDVGDASFAGRFSASKGPLKGLELIQVGVQSGDVVVGLTFMGTDPTEADDATQAAVDKAQAKLGRTGTV